jgi:hypothetical protein
MAIATIGYEQRARYAFHTFRPAAQIKTACGFESQQVSNTGEIPNGLNQKGFALRTEQTAIIGSG